MGPTREDHIFMLTRGLLMKSTAMVFVLLVMSHIAMGRTWTDLVGRTIEADLVQVKGDTVILRRDGREASMKIRSLSPEDREFIENWKKTGGKSTAVAAPANVTLHGQLLKKGGTMNLIEKPFSAEMLKELSQDDDEQDTLKLAISVPDDFNPAVPQKVFVVVTAVNNDNEKAMGNIGKFGMYGDTCTQLGWVCIAIDSNIGDPDGDCAMVEAFRLLNEEWPGIKSSTFATGGFSGGAKGCWFQACWLLKNKYNVTGVFMGGCNEDYSVKYRDEFNLSGSRIRKVHGYVSTGRTDSIANMDHFEKLLKSLKSNGVREQRSAVHDGGHAFYKPHFEEALKWFSEVSQ